jgi:predicted transposase/invertase (TIGR01784 family)
MEVYDYWNLREQGERNAVKEARDEGRQAGHREGRQAGRREGRQAGREEGRQAGEQVGLKKGREEGRQEGREEERSETARKMLAKGYDVAEVAELTGLPPDAIAALSLL